MNENKEYQVYFASNSKTWTIKMLNNFKKKQQAVRIRFTISVSNPLNFTRNKGGKVRRNRSLFKKEMKKKRPTMFINEAIETGASRAAIKPKNHRIFNRIPLRFNEVIEQISPMLLVDSHIPWKSIPITLKSETKNLQKQNQIMKITENRKSAPGVVLGRREPEKPGSSEIGAELTDRKKKKRAIKMAERKGRPDEVLVFAMAVEFGAGTSKWVLIGLRLQGISDAFGLFLYPTCLSAIFVWAYLFLHPAIIIYHYCYVKN